MNAEIEFPALSKKITREAMIRYSGGGGIHADDGAAKARGLSGAIVQGGQLVGYLTEMMIARFGNGFLEGGALSVSFIRQVKVDDTLTTAGIVTAQSETDDGTRCECDVWLANAEGEKMSVGNAVAFLRA